MDVAVVDDADEFAVLAGGLLERDPQRHTIELTVLDSIRRGGAPVSLMLVVRDGGAVVGAAMRTPGWRLLTSATPGRYAEAVAAVVAEVDPDVPGVTGPVSDAQAFAGALAVRIGARVLVGRRSRLFVLGELVEPPAVPGEARRAGEADVELLGRWREEFAVEADGRPLGTLAAQEQVLRALRLGGAEVVWWVEDVPVSLASARPVIAGMSRIGPVYTPPEHRGHGYAAAATAAASMAVVDAGAECVVLFADVANPTSSALYPRIGYRPVHDVVEFDLVAG